MNAFYPDAIFFSWKEHKIQSELKVEKNKHLSSVFEVQNLIYSGVNLSKLRTCLGLEGCDLGLTVAPTAKAKIGLTREAQGARESLCLLFTHIPPKRLSWCLKYSLSRFLTSRCRWY